MKNLIILFLIALGLRIGFALLFQFDGLYGQDPFAYFDYTIELRGALAAGQLPPPFFWPIGYPLLAVLASLITGLRPIAGQLVSILAGSLIAPLTYLIVLEIDPKARQGAVVAGLLLATAAQIMLSSLSYMSDATALAWASLSALAMLRHCRTLRSQSLIVAAFAIGWAVLTRWVYALLVIPFALAAFLAWQQAQVSWNQRLRLIASAVLISGLIITSQFVLTSGREQLSFVGNLEVTNWNPANAFKSTVTFGDGTFNYEQPVGIFYATPVLHPAFIFPLLTPFLLLAAWTSRKRPSYQTIIILGWPLIFYIFLIGTWENPRFSLAYFPPLALLTGLGLQSFWNAPPKLKLPITNYQLPNHKRLLTLYLALALLGSLVWSARNLRIFTTINNAQIAAARWVEEQVPADSTVITFGVTLTMQHRTELDTREIYNLDPDSLTEILQNQSPLYLYLDLDNINSQWQDLSPQLNYRWLQENGRLIELGRYPPYTLFQVTADP